MRYANDFHCKNVQKQKTVNAVLPLSAFGGIEVSTDDNIMDNNLVFWRLNFGQPNPWRYARLYDSNKGTYFKTPCGRVYLHELVNA